MTLAYGPLKPVGLRDPATGKMPFAVVQLRQDDARGEMFNLVGFQTRLKFDDQKRVFRMIPGLERAEFARFGVMHRNTYIASPGRLSPSYELKERPGLFFAGQITGVEGYVESASSGLVAGLAMAARIKNVPMPDFTSRTAIGALGHYVSSFSGGSFQPMNICFGLIDPMPERIRGKQDRYRAVAARALDYVEIVKKSLPN
jgi:methylenetetrahydrofolate--tRNA-(uracil-5-)-methyltransferase